MLRRTIGYLMVMCCLHHSTSSPLCEYKQFMEIGQTYYIHNQEYPRYSRGGTNCRWQAHSPPGTIIELNCYNVEIQQSSGCLGDYLKVSLSGDPGLSDGHRFCGNGNFKSQSVANRLVVTFSLGVFSYGGRFSCEINVIQKNIPCECGWSQKPRIVGGTETGVNEYPMMAALVDGTLRIIYCGSTIISNRFVLTAAHCLLERNPSEVAVLVGEHDTRVGNDTSATRLILSDQFIRHPGYEPQSQINDIALVRLSKELVFSQAVGPACLPIRFSAESFQGELVTVLGWGRTDFGGPLSPRLKQARLKVVQRQECISKLHDNVITDKQLCTYAVGEDACQSDSGGPVLWQDGETGRLQLVGIISYGIGCASDFPGVNTRVGAYIDWIKKSSKEDNYCVK